MFLHTLWKAHIWTLVCRYNNTQYKTSTFHILYIYGCVNKHCHKHLYLCVSARKYLIQYNSFVLHSKQWEKIYHHWETSDRFSGGRTWRQSFENLVANELYLLDRNLCIELRSNSPQLSMRLTSYWFCQRLCTLFYAGVESYDNCVQKLNCMLAVVRNYHTDTKPWMHWNLSL